MSMVSPHENVHFHWVDYLVFGLTLALSCSLGVYYGVQDKLRKRNTVEVFLLAGRSMSIFPVSVSMFVSWLSAISFIGDPVEVYYQGIMYWMQIIGFCTVLPLIAHFYVPRYHAMKLYSAFEFLEVRYNVTTRVVASVIHGITGGLHCGFVLYAPAICLAQVTGISVWVSIVCVGLICVFYTTLGGMKAVLWADTVQSAVMFLGLVLVVVRGCIVVGGVGQVWAIAEATGRTQFNFSPSPFVRSTVWSYVLSAFFDCLINYTSLQPYIQRYGTLRTAREAKLAVYLNILMFAVFVTLSTALGLVMVAYFDGCDPMTTGRVEKNDQIVPLIVLELLSFIPGFSGLFLASVFCASLSTLSSYLNSLSFNLLKDIVEPVYIKVRKQSLSAPLALILSKSFCVILGLVFIGVAMFFTTLKDMTIFQMTRSLYGSLNSPLCSLFFLGLFVKCTGIKGCMVGGFVSIAISWWWFLGSQLTDIGPQSHLGVSADNCTVYNTTGRPEQLFNNITGRPEQLVYNITGGSSQIVYSDDTTGYWTTLSPVTETGQAHDGFSVKTLYRFTPLLYMPFGFVATSAIASLIGLLSYRIGIKQNRKYLRETDQTYCKEMTELMQ